MVLEKLSDLINTRFWVEYWNGDQAGPYLLVAIDGNFLVGRKDPGKVLMYFNLQYIRRVQEYSEKVDEEGKPKSKEAADFMLQMLKTQLTPPLQLPDFEKLEELFKMADKSTELETFIKKIKEVKPDGTK